MQLQNGSKDPYDAIAATQQITAIGLGMLQTSADPKTIASQEAKILLDA